LPVRVMLTRLRESVQGLLAGEARMLHDLGFTPNHISGIGVLFASLAALFYWAWQIDHLFLLVAPIFFLLSGFCDALDGMVARLHNNTTVFGGFLDSLLDRYADAVILVAIITAGLSDASWGAVALAGSLLVSYTRARAEAAGIKMEMVGLAERAERIVIIIVASFAAFFWIDALRWSIILLAVVANFTVFQRTVHFYRASKKKNS
jgi:archaetidylinositol phosphate synthase